MDNLANLPAAVQIVLAVLLAVWLALLLLVPFMIESIRNSSRKSRAQLGCSIKDGPPHRDSRTQRAGGAIVGPVEARRPRGKEDDIARA
jgi:hypothetical protein